MSQFNETEEFKPGNLHIVIQHLLDCYLPENLCEACRMIRAENDRALLPEPTIKPFKRFHTFAMLIALVGFIGCTKTVKQTDGREYMKAMSAHYEACDAIAWKSADCESAEEDNGN